MLRSRTICALPLAFPFVLNHVLNGLQRLRIEVPHANRLAFFDGSFHVHDHFLLQLEKRLVSQRHAVDLCLHFFNLRRTDIWIKGYLSFLCELDLLLPQHDLASMNLVSHLLWMKSLLGLDESLQRLFALGLDEDNLILHVDSLKLGILYLLI
jgi:hypothetical protein